MSLENVDWEQVFRFINCFMHKTYSEKSPNKVSHYSRLVQKANSIIKIALFWKKISTKKLQKVERNKFKKLIEVRKLTPSVFDKQSI